MLPQTVTLIVEYRTTGGRVLPRALDDGTIVEVREDGVKRAPRSADLSRAIRWLMDHHYEPVEHRWISKAGPGLRRKRHVYQKADAQGAVNTLSARQN